MKRAEPHLLNQKIIRDPAPTVALLELTNRCDLACFHCLRDSPRSDDRPDGGSVAGAKDGAGATGAGELTHDEWTRVIDELAGIGTLCVSFSGGEPTLREDLVELIRHARARRMTVSLKTNGRSLATSAAHLAEVGLGQTEISLYSVHAATHERCTGVPGSFQETLAGIAAARRAGIPVTIAFFLFRWNANEAAAMRRLAADLACDAKRDYLLLPSDGGRRFDEAFVTAAQIRAIETAWPGATEQANQNGPGGITICAQGLNILGITARGDLLSCSTLRRPFGNVQRDGIAGPWRRLSRSGNRAELTVRGIDYRRFARCAACAFLPVCRICPGENFAATENCYLPPLERCFISQALYGRV